MEAICLPRRTWSSFLGLLFLETDLLLEMGILDDVDQSRGNLRVQHLEVWKIFSRQIVTISIPVMSQPSPLHNNASDGKSEQVVTCSLCRIFQTKTECGWRNLSNYSSDICCLCCPTINIMRNFQRYEPTHSRPPSCKCRHWNGVLI